MAKRGIVAGFKEAVLWFGGIFQDKGEHQLMCHRCKQSIIDDQAFILVRGDIMMYSNTIKAQVFTCPEQAFNYAQRLIMHSQCWIDMLREHDVELYDMRKVSEEYKKILAARKVAKQPKAVLGGDDGLG